MTDPTERALRLLSLLQSRPTWSGTELADRLGVTPRSIRRDIDRLRELGYPVRASQGVGGGYRLGAGKALPPLVLDDEEAVAVAVCLRLAAGGTVAGIGESAVRTMAKLDQILPARLRRTVNAIHDSTTTLTGTFGGVEDPVDSTTLLVVARACRETERIAFSYTSSGGEKSQRRAEPYRLVATGRRWYLMAFDLDREDWRTFRLDRMDCVRAGGWRFEPRPAPDAAEFVRRAISLSPYAYVAKIVVDAPVSEVRRWFPQLVASVEEYDGDQSLVSAGANRLEMLASHLAQTPWPITVLEPEELRAAFRSMARNLQAAARRR